MYLLTHVHFCETNLKQRELPIDLGYHHRVERL